MATKKSVGNKASPKAKAKTPAAQTKATPTPNPAARAQKSTATAPPATAAPKGKKKPAVVASRYDEIRNDLTRQKMRLLADAGLSTEGELSIDEALPDLGDRASVESDQTFSLRLLERGQKLTKKIEEALGRIQDGTFGICEVCGGEIAFRRLKARPVTTLCIDCKTAQEDEEKMKG